MSLAVSHGITRGIGMVLVALALVVALLPGRATPVRAQDDTAQADATLRVIHASPGAPEVDVLLDGQPLLQGLAYGTASNYATMTPEEHRVQIVPTGQTADAAVVDETIDAAPGQAYLVAVYGLLNDIGGDVYDVDLSEIEPGQARVRLINFSPDAGDVDLLETGGDEWFGDVGLGEASDYRDIAPGTYSADVRGGDDDRVLETVTDLTFEETRVYDVVVLGQIADDSLEVQSLVTTVSPSCAEVLGLEGASSDACVRLVHAAPDAPPVDVYLNDAQIPRIWNSAPPPSTSRHPAATDGVSASPPPARRSKRPSLTRVSISIPARPTRSWSRALATTWRRRLPAPIFVRWRKGRHALRVINASPDAGPIDIGVKGSEDNLFEGVDFRDATDYIVLDAGDYALEVRPGGEDMTVALESDATFEEGVTYDLVALGRPEDQTLTLLALMAEVPIQTGDVATPEATSAEGAVAATVVPAAIEDVEASPTPAG